MKRFLTAAQFLFMLLPALTAAGCKQPSKAVQPTAEKEEFPLVWQDTFTEISPARWSLGDWTFDHNLCEFTPAMVKITAEGLELQISKKGADKGKFREKPYWGAEVYGKERFLYGRFEVEMKPLCPPGVVASFFLMHDERDLQGNSIDWYEIDIEFPGTTRKISYALHYGEGGGIKSVAKQVPLDFDAAKEFHRYAIIWKPDSINFTIDGVPSASFTDAKILSELGQAMNIHMNYWVSDSESWVGRFLSGVLPIKTLYRSVTCRRWQPVIKTD